jgi:hypothetical protein
MFVGLAIVGSLFYSLVPASYTEIDQLRELSLRPPQFGSGYYTTTLGLGDVSVGSQLDWRAGVFMLGPQFISVVPEPTTRGRLPALSEV